MNKFLKTICSLPVILIVLYFLPFLGVCLTLFRYYIYKPRYKKYYNTPKILITCGVILLIPYITNYVVNLINIDISTIPYFSEFIASNIYTDLLKYSKFLITFGVILLILSYIFRNIYNSLISGVSSYIAKNEQRDREITEKNDLLMQEKRERAKNTHVVHCPYCGADNMLTSNTGTCKFCRREIEYKN
jgi:hypothetical protein